MRLAGDLLVDIAHGRKRAHLFLIGLFADALVLFADGAGAVGAGFGHQPGNFTGAVGGGLERLVEQAGEALEALLDILGADVERGDQRVELNAALDDG